MDKKANSQASWALLAQGVTTARVEAHRLRHLVNRALKMIEASENKDAFYEYAGDIIEGVPRRLDKIESDLDRTSYALTQMGDSFLRGRLSVDDREMVKETVTTHRNRVRIKKMAQQVCTRYLDETEE